MAQIVKLRRSSVSGQKPTNTNLQLGELAQNTTDGKIFLAKSGSGGPSIEEIIVTNTSNTGSINLLGSVTASNFTGAFIGDGSQLYNIPATGVTGLQLDRITSGNVSASISPSLGLVINTGVTITGSLTISGSNTLVQVLGDIQTDGFIRFDPVSKNIDTSISASYLFVSSSTNDLYFSQNGDGYSNVTRLRWLEGNMYSGLLHGGAITASGTTFNISKGSGIIVDLNASLIDDPYPTTKFVQWDTFTGQTLTNRTTHIQTFLAINDSGQIVQSTSPFVSTQYNTLINLGTVLHQNLSTVNGAISYPNVAYGYKQRTYDFLKAFGPLRLSGLNIVTSGSLGLNVGSGTAFAEGRNYQTDPNNPSYVTDSGTAVSKIFRYYQVSGTTFVQDTNGGNGYAVIDPTKYVLNGVLTNVGGDYSIQRVFWYPNSVTKGIVVYYGNATYGTIREAIDNLNIETFNEVENTKQNAVYLGSIIIAGNGDFTQSNKFAIVPGGLFRSIGGSGGGGNIPTSRLFDLSDVNITTEQDGDLLVYNVDSLKWESKKSLEGDYTITGSLNVTGGLTGSIDYSNITNKPTLVSGSSQIEITGTDGYTTFSSSVKDRIDVVTGSITDLSSSVKDRIDIVTGSITDLSSSVKDRIDIVTGSITDLSSSVKDRIDVVTGSITDLSSSVKDRIDTVTGSITDLSSSVKDRIDVVTGSVDSLNSFTSSYTTNSFTGSFIGDGSGLYNIPASGVTGLQLDKIINGNASASINNSGFYVNRDVFVDGTITAKEIHIDYVTSSVLYQSGSTKFGDSNDDTHQFTGSVKISGSLQSDSITGSFTGSFAGNASGLVNVPFHISGSDVDGGTYDKQFSKLQFDDSTGLNVSESVAGTAFISIGSHFRDIFVSGSNMLRATGSDAFEIIPEGGIEVTTSITDTNSNGYVKELRLSTTTLSSSLDTRIDNLSSSVVYQSETSSMTVLSSSYALTASFALNAGAGNEGRTFVHVQSTPSTYWAVTHNLGEEYPAITVYDSFDNVIIPSKITTVDETRFNVEFSSNQTGRVSATVGGGLPFVSASFVDYVLAVNNDVPYWKGGIISGSAQIILTGTTGYNTFSSSIATTTLNIKNRVDSIEVKTGSYATTGSNLFIGTQTLSGSIIPSVDNFYDLGSPMYQWRDVYISSGSLYIDGTKVISSTAQELQITTDSGQSIKILESGTDSIILQTADGDVELKSSGDGDILLDPTNGKIMLKGPVEILNGQKIQSSVGGTPVVFANDIVVSGSIELTGTIDGIDLTSFSSSANTRLTNLESSGGSLNSFTASANTRLGTLETESGSIRTAFNSYTSSANSRLSSIETSTGSLNTFSSSTSLRLTSLETESGSIRTDLNSHTSSANGRLTSIEVSTGSLNTFSSSTNSRLSSIETSTGSLNTFSSSTTTRLTAIETSTSSLNTFSSSTNTRLTAIETSTGSLNSYTSSNNTIIGTLQTATSSLNSFSSSTNTRLGALETESGSIRTAFNSYTSSNDGTNTTQNNRLTALETSTSSLNSFSSSTNSKLTSIETSTSSLNTFSSSTNTRVGALETESGSIRTAFNNYTSSNDGTNTTQNSRLTSLEGKTGSYATTGSNVLIGDQTITGSLYISQNLIIAGSSSIQHITSSQLNIGDNIITVNAQNPSIRFGGLAVIDSGSSPQVSGSLLFDATENEWIFVHQNQSSVTSALLIMGPETYDNVGNEVHLTNNRLVKSTIDEHVGDSNITDTGTKVSIDSNTEITGTFVATGTALVSGSAQISFNGITDKPTLVSGSSQITFLSISSIPSGLVSGSSQVLNGSGVWSGSAQLPAGVVSGSSQVSYTGLSNIPSGIVSGSSQVSFSGLSGVPSGLVSGSSQVLNGSGVWSGSAQLPSGVVSGSSQVSFSGLSSVPSGLVSGSSQISFGSISSIPSGLVSGSSQISFGSISGVPSGLVSGSSQISFGSISGVPSGLVSGSSQISFSSISGVPSGIVSGSAQLTGSYDSRYLIGTTNPGSVGNFTISIGNNGTYSYVQSHSSQPLELNPVGNTVRIAGSTVWHAGNLTNLNQLSNGPGYITGINSSAVTTALGYTPYNATNPNGYITGISFANVSSKPTTISGYGITDAITTGNISSQTVASAGNSTTVGGLTPIQFFNNMGDNHSTRTSFDASTPSYGFGFRFIQGNTNGPATGGGGQFYSWYIGLGNDYPATGGGSYGMHVAIPRSATTPYMSIRYNESNSLGSWIKIAAGYADTAGSATTAGSLTSMNISQFTNNSGYITGISFANVSSKPTTISGYGITDAITTGNIGSQSVSYASTAGALSSMNISQFTNNSGYATLSGANSFSNSYNEFGDGVGSVSNDGGWNGRLNVAGSAHARLDVVSVSDGIITSMYSHTGQNTGRVGTMSNHALSLMVNGSGRVSIDTSGHLLPNSNNAHNLGSSSLGWANVYTNDLHLSNMNKPEGNDIDGTNGNWTIQEGAENLYIINNNNGKKYKISLEEI